MGGLSDAEAQLVVANHPSPKLLDLSSKEALVPNSFLHWHRGIAYLNTRARLRLPTLTLNRSP